MVGQQNRPAAGPKTAVTEKEIRKLLKVLATVIIVLLVVLLLVVSGGYVFVRQSWAGTETHWFVPTRTWTTPWCRASVCVPEFAVLSVPLC